MLWTSPLPLNEVLISFLFQAAESLLEYLPTEHLFAQPVSFHSFFPLNLSDLPAGVALRQLSLTLDVVVSLAAKPRSGFYYLIICGINKERMLKVPCWRQSNHANVR